VNGDYANIILEKGYIVCNWS